MKCCYSRASVHWTDVPWLKIWHTSVLRRWFSSWLSLFLYIFLQSVHRSSAFLWGGLRTIQKHVNCAVVYSSRHRSVLVTLNWLLLPLKQFWIFPESGFFLYLWWNCVAVGNITWKCNELTQPWMKINEINNTWYIQCVFSFYSPYLHRNVPFMHEFAGLTLVGYLNLTNVCVLHSKRSGKWFQYVYVQSQSLLHFLHCKMCLWFAHTHT